MTKKNGNGAGGLASTAPKLDAETRIAQLPKQERDEIVERLNRDYCVILLGDRPVVLREGISIDGLPEFKILSTGGFHEWLRPEKYWTDRGMPIPASKIWLEDSRRRQYLGFTFSPGQDIPAGYYNLWKGFGVEPSEHGSCQRFLDHVANNVCRGDEALFAWVMGWFAQIVQQPTMKLGTSLVLRGPQGAGKSIVGDTIGALLGPHYQLVSDPRFITGRFNSHLVNCLLLQLDEATWGGDHTAAGKLKDLITGDHQLIEYKGKEPVRVKNYVRVLVTSNSDWIVPAGLEERRFAVLDVGEEQMQNSTYFRAIRAELDNGGLATLLHYLLSYDLTDVPLRQIPTTAALFEQKVASLSPELSWWLDILTRGTLPGDRTGEGVAPCHDLHEHYLDHAQRRGISRRSGETALGIFLRKHAPGVLRVRRTLLLGGSQQRPWCYQFPSLRECRAAFDRSARTVTDWADPEAAWGEFP